MEKVIVYIDDVIIGGKDLIHKIKAKINQKDKLRCYIRSYVRGRVTEK